MTVTETLSKHFDTTRTIPKNRLESLKKLGIHPDFMKQCEEMFNHCNVGVEEVFELKADILSANEKVVKGISELNNKRQAGNYKIFLKNAA